MRPPISGLNIKAKKKDMVPPIFLSLPRKPTKIENINQNANTIVFYC